MSIDLGLRSSARPYLIAEIGVNHEGDLSRAKHLIELAAEGGADAAKFQSYSADLLARADSPAYWDTSKESATSQRELFRRYDKFGVEDYEELARACEEASIDFMTTAFDERWVQALNHLVGVWKIASADITNVPLIRAVANTRKPIILSTGAASRPEIARATQWLREAGASSITLLHCVLNYPTPRENAQLSTIRALRRWFPTFPVGYSDHVPPTDDGGLPALIRAVEHGATVLEKHFTDTPDASGNDHYHAATAEMLRQFRDELRIREILDGEEPVDDKDLEAEVAARTFARRGIVVARSIDEGDTIRAADLRALRPADGAIPVENWDVVVGRRAVTAVEAGAPLRWADLEAEDA